MVCNLNTTNLAQVDGGSLIKQGDVASTFGFVLLDEDYRARLLSGRGGGGRQSDHGQAPVEEEGDCHKLKREF